MEALRLEEERVRAEMRERTRGRTGVLPMQLTAPAAAPRAARAPTDVEAELRKLGLGSGAARLAPGPPPVAAPRPAATTVAPASAAPVVVADTMAAVTTAATRREVVLTARKAQVHVAKKQLGLRSLRAAGGDSDDDDGGGGGDDDDSGAPSRPARADGGPAERGGAATFGRALNQLADSEASVRAGALAQLGASAEGGLSSDQWRELVRPLLLRFADPVEKCRDAAIGLFRRWRAGPATDASDVAGVLPFLVPVLVERLGSETVAEPAEELRAALAALLADVLAQCRQLLRPYLHEVGAICLGCCRDNHPEVIKSACALLVLVSDEVLRPLVAAQGSKPIQPYSSKLLEAVLPHVRHRHAAVRLAVLDALEATLLCGAGSSVETLVGWRLPNNVPIAEFYGKGEPRINYLADLSRDRSVLVRRRLVDVAARWIREMDPADLYEQEVRLMPYLASGLCDTDDEARASALRHIEALGEEYVRQNEDEFKQTIEYMHDEEAAAAAALTLPLPDPFERRPSIGARARVRKHFRALIHPICAELGRCAAAARVARSACPIPPPPTLPHPGTAGGRWSACSRRGYSSVCSSTPSITSSSSRTSSSPPSPPPSTRPPPTWSATCARAPRSSRSTSRPPPTCHSCSRGSRTTPPTRAPRTLPQQRSRAHIERAPSPSRRLSMRSQYAGLLAPLLRGTRPLDAQADAASRILAHLVDDQRVTHRPAAANPPASTDARAHALCSLPRGRDPPPPRRRSARRTRLSAPPSAPFSKAYSTSSPRRPRAPSAPCCTRCCYGTRPTRRSRPPPR